MCIVSRPVLWRMRNQHRLTVSSSRFHNLRNHMMNQVLLVEPEGQEPFIIMFMSEAILSTPFSRYYMSGDVQSSAVNSAPKM